LTVFINKGCSFVKLMLACGRLSDLQSAVREVVHARISNTL